MGLAVYHRLVLPMIGCNVYAKCRDLPGIKPINTSPMNRTNGFARYILLEIICSPALGKVLTWNETQGDSISLSNWELQRITNDDGSYVILVRRETANSESIATR